MNGYCKISLFNHEIVVPHVALREEVEVHLAPDVAREALEVSNMVENQGTKIHTNPQQFRAKKKSDKKSLFDEKI